MTTCSTSIFPNATTARSLTRTTVTVIEEVCAIEVAVLGNVELGLLSANITSGTTMTDSNAYYKAYNDITTDPSLVDQINVVKEHFLNLGYGVKIFTNPQTTDTITWNINW